MGLFGKKKKFATCRGGFYDGDLPGFSVDDPVELTLTEDAVTIAKLRGKPLTVTLSRERVTGFDFYAKEKDFMLKNHGQSAETLMLKKLGTIAEKNYFTLRYTSKDGEEKKISFWAPVLNGMQVMSFQSKLKKSVTVEDYEL